MNTMPEQRKKTGSLRLSRAKELRESVLLTICEHVPSKHARLLHASQREWRALLHWLDTSGLALYFLDRLTELNLLEVLPATVLSRLQQDVCNNTEKIGGMIAEQVHIQRRLHEAGLSYAVLKGFSLWPVSVPKLELRSQLDLDFLVAEESASEARKILEEYGYRLNAISGGTWEFKANEGQFSSLRDLYKTGKSRSVDLHLEARGTKRPSLLSRSQSTMFHGVPMRVLSPVDLFLGQGLHFSKHVCSEFSRTAHLVEFRRHIIARRDDEAFWKQLRQCAVDDPQACLRLGAAIHLITVATGEFAPGALTRWTSDRLPSGARLWIERYGHRMALASFPGSKLYLLLQQELEFAGVPAKRSLRQALIPRRLPPAITHAKLGETLPVRVHCFQRQLNFIFFRLRFHLVEGFRYLCESILWRHYRNCSLHLEAQTLQDARR